MKNWGIVLIQNTGKCYTSSWKVSANSSDEAREKLLDFIKADEGFNEFEKALNCGFPYRTNYCGYSDNYTENCCLEMTSENLKKQYQSYAKDVACWNYYGNHCKNTSIQKYCDKYGIVYKIKEY